MPAKGLLSRLRASRSARPGADSSAGTIGTGSIMNWPKPFDAYGAVRLSEALMRHSFRDSVLLCEPLEASPGVRVVTNLNPSYCISFSVNGKARAPVYLLPADRPAQSADFLVVTLVQGN